MRKLGQVALVFAALLVLVQLPAMASAAFAVSVIWETGGALGIGLAGIAVLPVLIAVAMAAVIILKRRELASRWFDDEDVAISVDAVSLMRVALVTVGIVVVIQAITGFLFGLGDLVTQTIAVGPAMAGNEVGQFWPFVVNIASRPVVSLVSLGIGIWLIRASDALSKRLFATPAEVAAASDELGMPSAQEAEGDR